MSFRELSTTELDGAMPLWEMQDPEYRWTDHEQDKEHYSSCKEGKRKDVYEHR